MSPNEFVLVNQHLIEAPRDEWMALLSDETEIVISGDAQEPSAAALRRAASVIGSRAMLESDACKLLSASGPPQKSWRLLTIDFGAAAHSAQCDFLMCFAGENSSLETGWRYAEVAFVSAGAEPEQATFRLRICSTW